MNSLYTYLDKNQTTEICSQLILHLLIKFFTHTTLCLWTAFRECLNYLSLLTFTTLFLKQPNFNSVTQAIFDSLTYFQFFHSYSTAMRPFRPFWLTFFNLTDKGCSCWNNLMKPDFTDNIRHRESLWELKLMQPFG